MLNKASKKGKALALRALAGRAADARRGFTLIEIVVAVGAVALVAVGLAAIFDTVGKTVTGGRRVSNLNTYAGLLESQLRADFDAMSRDGFLVIRQQWVDGPDPAAAPADGKFNPTDTSGPGGSNKDAVPVSNTQEPKNWRPRRIDEIIFFVNGHFESAREPLAEGVQATSNQAMVYYGHGQAAPWFNDATHEPDPATGYRKVPKPSVDDRNGDVQSRLGLKPSARDPESNPNRYAGDWTLLRHLTLLTKPQSADSVPSVEPDGTPMNSGAFGFKPNVLRDHPMFTNQPTQIGLQPAASSIFRSIESFYPGNNAADTTFRLVADGGTFKRPFLGSGIIDIATTNFAEIRAIITAGSDQPAPANLLYPADILANTNLPLLSQRSFIPSSVTASGGFPGARPSSFNNVDRMQAWMSDAFPTESRNAATLATTNDFNPDSNESALGTRMRYEPGATDLLTAMQPAPGATSLSNTDQLKLAEARTDQLMLSRGNLVPHCSDFRVDWSFGQMDGQGNLVWHDQSNPYPPVNAQGQYIQFARPVTGAIFNKTTGVTTALPPQVVTDRLIYGFTPRGDESCLTSYFGWTDPTYAPTVPANSVLVGGTPSWPWPRMIRVTVTLSDPQDPTIESTFQYVFTTPADPK